MPTLTINEVHRIYTCRNSSHGKRHERVDYIVTTEWDGLLALRSEFEDMDGKAVIIADAVYHRCKECNNVMESIDVIGIENEESKCDLSCMNAFGPLCVCACGGKNHGASWLLVA